MAQESAVVRVPATSANLGPGFDTLGVALDWTALFRFTISDTPVERPDGPVERMAVTAALALYSRAVATPPAGIEVAYEGDIPIGRGLGLSAAARVAGLVGANALMEGGHEPHTLLALAAQLEGHGDNAMPAMFGGIQIVVSDEDVFDHVGLTPPDDLRLVLLVPDFSMPTQESRRRLPERITRNQAVHNISRAAMLVAAIGQRRYDLLRLATEDVLHQPTRAGLFPPMYQIFQAARDAGAHGAYLSGGGSTIAAFATDHPDDVAGAMREAAAAHGYEAQTRICRMSEQGAEVITEA